MRTFIKILITIIFLVPFKSFPQEIQIYTHPTLKFQFEASGNWINIPHPEDKLIYEMISPDSIIHVILWYTETEQSAKNFLLKMALLKDLVVTNEVPMRTLNHQDMWLLKLPGYERKTHVRMVLGVTALGMSEDRPKENFLYIIQIWCPKEKYQIYESIIEDILKSVTIEN